MTTAHRPTFYQALGGENQGGNFIVAPTTKVSSRDLPGHTTLKRYNVQPRPMYSDDVPEQTLENDREKLKTLLNKKEKEYYEKKERQKSIFGPIEAISDVPLLRSTDDVSRVLQALPESNDNAYPEDEDDCGPLVSSTHEKRSQSLSQMNQESEDDTDEDEAELLRELEVIKRERQQEELSRTLHSENETRSQEHLNILQSNPLMIHQDTTLKRRWDDDVVFRNQAKNICKPKKRFINDTVRSDFHKKFLARYIQ